LSGGGVGIVGEELTGIERVVTAGSGRFALKDEVGVEVLKEGPEVRRRGMDRTEALQLLEREETLGEFEDDAAVGRRQTAEG